MPRLDCRGPDRIRQWRRDRAARGLGRERARELGVDNARLRRLGLGRRGRLVEDRPPLRLTAPLDAPASSVGRARPAPRRQEIRPRPAPGGLRTSREGAVSRTAAVPRTRGFGVAGGALGPAGDGLLAGRRARMARGMTGDAASSARRARTSLRPRRAVSASSAAGSGPRSRTRRARSGSTRTSSGLIPARSSSSSSPGGMSATDLIQSFIGLGRPPLDERSHPTDPAGTSRQAPPKRPAARSVVVQAIPGGAAAACSGRAVPRHLRGSP